MEKHERLKLARESAGYPSAASAAEAMHAAVPTYCHHENGTRGFDRHLERYARFFRVNLEWLATGRGEMRGRNTGAAIPVSGYVWAGTPDMPVTAPLPEMPAEQVKLPEVGQIAALQVKGISGYPRFLDGEWILYDPRPVQPDEVLGHYAIVDTEDGRRLIKTVRQGQVPGTYDLHSHNAPEIRNVVLLCAYRYLGMLA